MSKPLLRGYFHQMMFFISLGACLVLIANSGPLPEVISTVIYSFGVLLLFGVSAIYHRLTWKPKPRALLRKLDHSAIYIMIAGTFTPVCLLALSRESSFTLLIIIWSVTGIGVFKSIFFTGLPKLLNALLYLVAGYLVLPYMSELIANVGSLLVGLIILGGVFYSLGALCYGLKKPNFNNSQIFGYHETFHILVSLGAITHFIVIYSLVHL